MLSRSSLGRSQSARSLAVALVSSALGSGVLLAAVACRPGPLPPETPQERPTERAPLIDVIHTTSPGPAPSAVSPVVVFENAGLLTPGNAVHDPVTDTYLVSNVNGSPFDADDNGFISRLAPDGSVAQLKFIDGASAPVTLHAPQGMFIDGRTLYVADITALRSFNLDNGQPLRSIELTGSTLLSSVAGIGQLLYVSDSAIGKDLNSTGTDAIYQVSAEGAVTPLLRSHTLAGPTALVASSGELLAVTFHSNRLLHVDAAGKVTSEVQLPAGSLDGMVRLEDGRLLVSSWKQGGIYRGTDKFEVLIGDLPEPAGLGLDQKRQRLLVALPTQNRVVVYGLNP